MNQYLIQYFGCRVTEIVYPWFRSA